MNFLGGDFDVKIVRRPPLGGGIVFFRHRYPFTPSDLKSFRALHRSKNEGEPYSRTTRTTRKTSRTTPRITRTTTRSAHAPAGGGPGCGSGGPWFWWSWRVLVVLVLRSLLANSREH